MDFSLSSLQTPCYVVDEALLEKNLMILKQVMDRTGCKILLAQKAFSMFACYPLIGTYLNGTTASGLFEARLGKEEMGGETAGVGHELKDGDILLVRRGIGEGIRHRIVKPEPTLFQKPEGDHGGPQDLG